MPDRLIYDIQHVSGIFLFPAFAFGLFMLLDSIFAVCLVVAVSVAVGKHLPYIAIPLPLGLSRLLAAGLSPIYNGLSVC